MSADRPTNTAEVLRQWVVDNGEEPIGPVEIKKKPFSAVELGVGAARLQELQVELSSLSPSTSQ